MALDRTKPGLYPPNIQAILKRAAPAAIVLGQEVLEVDAKAGRVRVFEVGAEVLQRGAAHP